MFCGKCGTQLSNTDKFCPRCGEKVQQVTEEKKVPSTDKSNINVHKSSQSIDSSTITHASNQKSGTLKKSILDNGFIRFIIPAILLTVTFCLKCAKNSSTESSSEEVITTETYSSSDFVGEWIVSNPDPGQYSSFTFYSDGTFVMHASFYGKELDAEGGHWNLGGDCLKIKFNDRNMGTSTLTIISINELKDISYNYSRK